MEALLAGQQASMCCGACCGPALPALFDSQRQPSPPDSAAMPRRSSLHRCSLLLVLVLEGLQRRNHSAAAVSTQRLHLQGLLALHAACSKCGNSLAVLASEMLHHT